MLTSKSLSYFFRDESKLQKVIDKFTRLVLTVTDSKLVKFAEADQKIKSVESAPDPDESEQQMRDF